MGKDRFLNMALEELDMEIDRIPYGWMKALMYQGIKSIRPDYIREREENNNDRKSKSKSSR